MTAPTSENLSSVDWPRRMLPEDYGTGQRQYDMALAAKLAAEPYVWTTAAGAFSLTSVLVNPFLGLGVFVAAYWFCMRPLKKRLKHASDEWELDRQAWERHVASWVPSSGNQP